MSQHPQDPIQLAEEIRAALESPDAEKKLGDLLREIRSEDIAVVLDDLSPPTKKESLLCHRNRSSGRGDR